jgi:hypothetical protein
MANRIHRWAKFLLILLTWTAPALAWGPQVHRIVGVEAVRLLDPALQAEVAEIIGGDSDDEIGQACNWPDEVRETPAWNWSGPLHYVNIPHHASTYDRQRDCPDGLCITEGIRKFAAELGRPELGTERRRQAFAWLCHLVGDLHQPLHAGFGDDRGGNRVMVSYRGQSYNLHEFWDSVLVEERLGRGDCWPCPAAESSATADALRWDPADVDGWTAESHRIAARQSYPPQPQIGEEFADQSWLLMRQQWQKAAWRLASILETVLGPAD